MQQDTQIEGQSHRITQLEVQQLLASLANRRHCTTRHMRVRATARPCMYLALPRAHLLSFLQNDTQSGTFRSHHNSCLT